MKCVINGCKCSYGSMPQTGNRVKLFDLEGTVIKGICEKPFLPDYKVKVLWDGATQSFIVPSDVLTIV
jgi:hypothetical protein